MCNIIVDNREHKMKQLKLLLLSIAIIFAGHSLNAMEQVINDAKHLEIDLLKKTKVLDACLKRIESLENSMRLATIFTEYQTLEFAAASRKLCDFVKRVERLENNVCELAKMVELLMIKKNTTPKPTRRGCAIV